MTTSVNRRMRAAGVAAISVGLLASGAGIAAADDPNAVPEPILTTQCSVDQLMAATKVVDPPAYDAIVTKYSQEPPVLQDQVRSRMKNLLSKDPAGRQAEVDQFAIFFPYYAALFRTQESSAPGIAEQCSTFPADDPSVWIKSTEPAATTPDGAVPATTPEGTVPSTTPSGTAAPEGTAPTAT